MKYKAQERYSFGWANWKALATQPPAPLRPMQWECQYCRSRHLITIDECPNCGAPK